MSKRHRRDDAPPSHFELERTLEAAEADPGGGTDKVAPSADVRCLCGNPQLLLQAFFSVESGQLSREPLELEGLTCPDCDREYEAVLLEDGRVVRGELLGYAELDDDDDA